MGEVARRLVVPDALGLIARGHRSAGHDHRARRSQILADKDVVRGGQRTAAQVVGAGAAVDVVPHAYPELTVHDNHAVRLVQGAGAAAASDIHVAVTSGGDRAAVDVQAYRCRSRGRRPIRLATLSAPVPLRV